MKKYFLAVSFGLLAATSITAQGKGACKEKRRAMHDARVALKECNKSWADSVRGDATDPSDDCSAKQSAYVTGVKEFKACVKEEKEKAKK